MTFLNLNGNWNVTLSDGTSMAASLPGTLDENQIGHADVYNAKLFQDENYVENESLTKAAAIATRFTRNFTYEGEAVYTKIFEDDIPADKRAFLDIERTRALRLYIDDNKVEPVCGTLSTPYSFEVTGLLKKGSSIKLVVDNSYKDLPRECILYSSAATDETQTNWNGILGIFGVRLEEDAFIDDARIYADTTANVCIGINSNHQDIYTLCIDSDAFESPITKKVDVKIGTTRINIENIKLKRNVKKWDEYEGNLYDLSISLKCKDNTTTINRRYGIRCFEDDGKGHLCLNKRRVFLRSEANCCVFPETGHAPMDVNEWKKVISTYTSYGVNCLRFHSHCPPKAAFTAADELGVLMQPELSNWNPRDAFSTEIERNYYKKELEEIILTYANHPSFVMLTFGNELQMDDESLKYMHKLIDRCHELDCTRLYAIGSNVYYGAKGCDEKSDFYTSMMYHQMPLRATFDGMRGYLNNEYPNSMANYDASMEELRKKYSKPVFSFEVGQYEVLPDFDEINDFNKVTKPDNYELIKEKVISKGLKDTWKQRVEATGELSLLCYRQEVEAALRTKDFSGISLLGLQDFPGQGTALVGMLNSHLKSKPYSFADPKRFNSFFRQVLPLVYLEKYTYTNTERLCAKVKLANYSSLDLTGELIYSISKDGKVIYSSTGSTTTSKSGDLTDIGTIEIDLCKISSKIKDDSKNPEKVSECNSQLELKVFFGDSSNSYPIWIYDCENVAKRTDDVYETKTFDKKAIEVLKGGGKVYLTPDASAKCIKNSIKSTFSTDFWSVGTFASQEGSMGLLIEDEHPIFKAFPTGKYTNYQWWPMASQRAMILPDNIKSIVTVLDSYAYLRNMGMLFECNCCGGKVLVSSMGLHNLTQYPECRALLSGIYAYLSSDEFAPDNELTPEDLEKIL